MAVPIDRPVQPVRPSPHPDFGLIHAPGTPRRHPLRVPYGKRLYLFITPSGVRSWQYRYRYRRKQQTLSLGVYRYVPTKVATMRHQAARQLLAAGVDPKGRKTALHRLWLDQPVTRTTA